MTDFELNLNLCRKNVHMPIEDEFGVNTDEIWGNRPASEMSDFMLDDLRFILASGAEAGASERSADEIINDSETVSEAFAAAFPHDW